MGERTASAFRRYSTYTAANGDELHSTNAGFATPTATGLDLSGIETAVGGTGRFAGASGQATFSGTASLATNTGAFSFEGTVAY